MSCLQFTQKSDKDRDDYFEEYQAKAIERAISKNRPLTWPFKNNNEINFLKLNGFFYESGLYPTQDSAIATTLIAEKRPKMPYEISNLVHMKICNKSRGSLLNTAVIDRMSTNIDHVNLVVPLRVLHTPADNFVLISNFCEGIPINKFMQHHDFDSTLARDLFKQMMSCFAYCHMKGYLHNNLTPASICVKEGPVPQVKITDFAIPAMTDMRRMEKLFDKNVCFSYEAPEVLGEDTMEGKTFATTGKSNVFSLGVILHEMLTGSLPFTGTRSQVLAKMSSRNRVFKEALPKKAQNLLRQMLNQHTFYRPSANACLKHFWLGAAKVVNRKEKSSPIKQDLDSLWEEYSDRRTRHQCSLPERPWSDQIPVIKETRSVATSPSPLVMYDAYTQTEPDPVFTGSITHVSDSVQCGQSYTGLRNAEISHAQKDDLRERLRDRRDYLRHKVSLMYPSDIEYTQVWCSKRPTSPRSEESENDAIEPQALLSESSLKRQRRPRLREMVEESRRQEELVSNIHTPESVKLAEPLTATQIRKPVSKHLQIAKQAELFLHESEKVAVEPEPVLSESSVKRQRRHRIKGKAEKSRRQVELASKVHESVKQVELVPEESKIDAVEREPVPSEPSVKRQRRQRIKEKAEESCRQVELTSMVNKPDSVKQVELVPEESKIDAVEREPDPSKPSVKRQRRQRIKAKAEESRRQEELASKVTTPESVKQVELVTEESKSDAIEPEPVVSMPSVKRQRRHKLREKAEESRRQEELASKVNTPESVKQVELVTEKSKIDAIVPEPVVSMPSVKRQRRHKLKEKAEESHRQEELASKVNTPESVKQVELVTEKSKTDAIEPEPVVSMPSVKRQRRHKLKEKAEESHRQEELASKDNSPESVKMPELVTAIEPKTPSCSHQIALENEKIPSNHLDLGNPMKDTLKNEDDIPKEDNEVRRRETDLDLDTSSASESKLDKTESKDASSDNESSTSSDNKSSASSDNESSASSDNESSASSDNESSASSDNESSASSTVEPDIDNVCDKTESEKPVTDSPVQPLDQENHQKKVVHYEHNYLELSKKAQKKKRLLAEQEQKELLKKQRKEKELEIEQQKLLKKEAKKEKKLAKKEKRLAKKEKKLAKKAEKHAKKEGKHAKKEEKCAQESTMGNEFVTDELKSQTDQKEESPSSTNLKLPCNKSVDQTGADEHSSVEIMRESCQPNSTDSINGQDPKENKISKKQEKSLAKKEKRRLKKLAKKDKKEQKKSAKQENMKKGIPIKKEPNASNDKVEIEQNRLTEKDITPSSVNCDPENIAKVSKEEVTCSAEKEPKGHNTLAKLQKKAEKRAEERELKRKAKEKKELKRQKKKQKKEMKLQKEKEKEAKKESNTEHPELGSASTTVTNTETSLEMESNAKSDAPSAPETKIIQADNDKSFTKEDQKAANKLAKHEKKTEKEAKAKELKRQAKEKKELKKQEKKQKKEMKVEKKQNEETNTKVKKSELAIADVKSEVPPAPEDAISQKDVSSPAKKEPKVGKALAKLEKKAEEKDLERQAKEKKGIKKLEKQERKLEKYMKKEQEKIAKKEQKAQKKQEKKQKECQKREAKKAKKELKKAKKQENGTENIGAVIDNSSIVLSRELENSPQAGASVETDGKEALQNSPQQSNDTENPLLEEAIAVYHAKSELEYTRTPVLPFTADDSDSDEDTMDDSPKEMVEEKLPPKKATIAWI